MYATFNITNNRFKFYPESAERLTPEQDKERRAACFQWYPGQKCWSAIWSPAAEDWIKSWGVEILEDDTPDDVEARVNRFGRYATNAEESAEDAAERAANASTARRARLAESRATNESERAEYWQRRIAGAISHAQHHDNPQTCLNRIKGIEADKRKHERDLKAAQSRLDFWQRPGLTLNQAKSVANYDHTPARGSSLWFLLDKGEISAAEAAALAIPFNQGQIDHANRWIEHLARRLEYERAYLIALGGSDLLDRPKKKPTRRAAPEDGLKKGDRVSYPASYFDRGRRSTGTIKSLGALNVIVIPDNPGSAWADGRKVYRKDCQKVA